MKKEIVSFAISRRLRWLIFLLVLPPCLVAAGSSGSRAGKQSVSWSDDRFLDKLERAGFLFFCDAGDPRTGLVKDRSSADGPDEREPASIAATGFGLTALCIADERGYHPHPLLLDRVVTTLRYLARRLPNEHGFFYHFMNSGTGERFWNCELSTIDTAILLCGVLTCRQHFHETEVAQLAAGIVDRVDWPWMLADNGCISHGWKPENGLLKNQWNSYSELMMIYLLALGSSTHPIPEASWHAWSRPAFEYGGLRYINPKAPLFIHQYSHAWFDFRGRRDRYADYFENSVIATRAHRQFCLDLRPRFPQFSEDLWGITASDSARGYLAWGGPPEQGRLDGTLVPAAAGGSIAFLPDDSIRVLRKMRNQFGSRVWKRYGFVDAFNPHSAWFAPDVVGIDVGITLLMAENARTQFVWRTFMKNEEARRGMERAGFNGSR